MRGKEKIEKLYGIALNIITNNAVYNNSKYTTDEVNDLAVYVRSMSELSKRIEEIAFFKTNNSIEEHSY